MYNLEIAEKEDWPFIGIISSDYQGEELKHFKSYATNFYNNGGGTIYTYIENDGPKMLDYLGGLWDLDLNQLYDMGKIIPIHREDYLMGNHIDSKGFLLAIERGLDELDKNGFKDKKVNIIVDSFWDPILEGNVQYIYDRLRTLCEEKSAQIIFRYIIDELEEDHIKALFNNHTILLVDGSDGFEMYTPQELVSQGLSLLSKFNSLSKRYENEMIRVEYLKTLGELAEGTVHDISNLLITILGYSELILTMEDCLEMDDYLKIIHKTALDGKIIIDRIRDYIRGSYSHSKDMYEFNHIINSCIEMTKHKFKPCFNVGMKRLELVVDLNSKGYVYVNEYEIRQSVINIILNGVDAMEDSGIMTIRTYDIEDQIVLEIVDTGKGMNESTIEKIFDPYFSTKGTKGTGLGLNIAKRIFDKHEAKIYVDSQIDKGTKFTIFFPAE